MKIKTAVFLFIFYIVSMFSSTVCYAETIEHEVNVPPKILVLGDSIAAGYGLEGYSTDRYSCDSYANILHREYDEELSEKCGNKLINSSVVGDTSEQLLEHLKNNEFDKDLKDSNAVIISIGGNDILGFFIDFLINDLGVNSETTKEELLEKTKDIMGIAMDMKRMSDDMDSALNGFGGRLNEIIENIKSKSNAQIIVQTLYDPLADFDEAFIFQSMSKDKISRLNKIITDNAVDENGNERYLVSDVYTEFDRLGTRLTNIMQYDIHPNADGHTMIAACIDKVVRSRTYSYEETVPDKKNTANSLHTVLIISGTAGGTIIIAAVALLISHNRKGHKV